MGIEEKKLDGLALVIILAGHEFPIPRASVSTVRDVKNVLLAKVGLDKVGRDLRLSAGQAVFTDKDSIRKLPAEVHATVVAFATFKQPERRKMQRDADENEEKKGNDADEGQ